MDSVYDEMGNVGNDNLGFREARFEGVLPLIVVVVLGFEDLDGVEYEAFDAWGQKGCAFGAVARFDSRENGLRHWVCRFGKEPSFT